MLQTRWKQIEEIFQSALDLLPSERSNFVSVRCAKDAGLQSAVEKLLADYDSAKYDSMIGRRVGNYEIMREIGRGGMGAVYLATRADGIFRRQVAVKLIKRGMDTDFILRRFRQERQILASLNHQFIARLLDGGTTDDDLPYFVMEFIEGKPLYRYCDRKKLSIVERLKLFRQICLAIDFAHQNRVIHRDIKPPNILVTDASVPKLLDFGIAKVLNAELGFETIEPTATAMRLMTPEYASPEQVCGGEITPASDIYSLGVLLYELLTGHRPYQFPNRAPHEIARIICDQEPLRPSSGVTLEDSLLPTGASEATTLVDVYVLRGAANFEDLQRELSGDLEKIILKALRKEPTERYKTAAEFARDITRYLEDKPIAAEVRFPAVVETRQLITKSEKSIAVLPLKLIGGAAIGEDTGDNYLCIGLADALITRLSNVRRFVVRPTSSVIPYGKNEIDAFAAGKELGVSFVVDGNIGRVGNRIRVTAQLLSVNEHSTRWAQSFDEDFSDVLALEDSISEKVAKSLVPHLTGAEEKQLKKRGTDNSEAFEAYLRGRHHWNTLSEDGFAKALIFYNQAISIAPDYALAYAGIADYYNLLGVYAVMPFKETSAAAKQAAQKAIALDDSLAEAYAALGFAVLMHDFNWEETERHLSRAVELNPNYVTGRIWYGSFLTVKGDWDEALKQIRRAVELDSLTPFVSHTLNLTLYYARRFDEAIAATEKFIRREPNYGLAQLFLSSMLWRVGRADEALKFADRAISLLGRTPYSLVWLASAHAASGNAEKAKKIIAEIEELSARRYASPYLLAIVHANLNDAEKALELLEKAWEIRDGRLAWLGVEPQFDRLRAYSRFEKILRATKNPIIEKIALKII